MSSSRRFLAGVIACAFLVAGCGDDKKAPPAATASGGGAGPAAAPAAGPPAAMLALLPEGTVGVVYVPSVKDLEDGVRRLMAAAGETSPSTTVNFAKLAESMGLDAADLDLGGSAAVAMTQSPDSPMPVITAILPVVDEKGIAAKVKKENPGATVETAGGFAAVTPEGAYKRAGPPPHLRAPLPAGVAVIRLDVAALWKALGPMASAQADDLLEMMKGNSAGGPDPAATMKPMLDGLKSVLDAASVMDLAFRIDGTAVEMDVTVRFADGTKAPFDGVFAKADLATLARAVPDEGMVSIAAAVNPAKMWSVFQSFMKASLEVYPEADRAAFQRMFDSAGGLMNAMGNGMVVSADLTGAGGFQGAGAIESPDPAAYVKSFAEVWATMGATPSFMTLLPIEERVVDGTKVTTWRIKVDAEKLPEMAAAPGAPDMREMMGKMFGKDPLIYNFAPLGNKIVFVMGGDEKLKRTLQAAKAGPGAPQGSLSKALAAAGPDTVGYLRYDLTALMRFVGEIMPSTGVGTGKPKLGPPLAGDPVVLTCILNAGPNEVRGRMSLDVGKLMKMVKGMSPK